MSLLLFSVGISSGQSFSNRIDHVVHKYDSLGSYNGIIILGFGHDSVMTFEYGYKDPTSKKDKISIKDLFDLASLTKQFTGLAVLQLIDQRVLKPDDSIGKYFPELKPALQKVTIQQLANHTNGIHDFYSLTSRHDTLSVKSTLKLLSGLDSTVFSPGTKWGYSNSGYFLLSELVERATHRRFWLDYMSNDILHPLNMSNFDFGFHKTGTLSGYTSSLQPLNYNAFASGEAGLYCSGTDMISYYKTVCNDSVKWNKLFSNAYNLSDNSNEQNWKYGFGWYYSQDKFGTFRAHSGKNEGAFNYIRWYDKSNVFICMLSNKSDSFIKQLREEIVVMLTTELKK